MRFFSFVFCEYVLFSFHSQAQETDGEASDQAELTKNIAQRSSALGGINFPSSFLSYL